MTARLLAIVLVASLAQAQALRDNTECTVKLLSPISTQTSKKGDRITAQILSPPAFSGAFVEGEVRNVKGGAKIKGRSVLNFTFNTLHVGEQRKPIRSSVKSMANSQGKMNVDEEGNIVERKNNTGKIVAATAVGAAIGALAGGGKGAAMGAGIGAAASLILIEVGATGANVSFAPGSQFVLDVSPAN